MRNYTAGHTTAAKATATAAETAATVVSGKAFLPQSQKLKRGQNNKVYAQHTMTNLQGMFYHAGFTPNALGIMASKKFDPTRFKNC